MRTGMMGFHCFPDAAASDSDGVMNGSPRFQGSTIDEIEKFYIKFVEFTGKLGVCDSIAEDSEFRRSAHTELEVESDAASVPRRD